MLLLLLLFFTIISIIISSSSSSSIRLLFVVSRVFLKNLAFLALLSFLRLKIFHSAEKIDVISVFFILSRRFELSSSSLKPDERRRFEGVTRESFRVNYIIRITT